MLELNFHETQNGLLREFLYPETKGEWKKTIHILQEMGFKCGQKDKDGNICFSLGNKRVEVTHY